MRIQNADSREVNGYEVIVICKNDSEEAKAISNLRSEGFVLDGFEELEINVYADENDYATKAEFIKDIRKIAKK